MRVNIIHARRFFLVIFAVVIAALALTCPVQSRRAVYGPFVSPPLRLAGDNGDDVAQKSDVAYGILLDAGSGSTKPSIWSWNPCYSYVPEMVQIQELDKLPALSSYAKSMGGNPDDAGISFLPALEAAKEFIPQEQRKHAPVFLTATAGMRLLPESERAYILRVVNIWLADPANHPYLYGTKPPFDDGQFWAQTISGDDEGAYGFLDINFLLGKLAGQESQRHGATVNQTNSKHHWWKKIAKESKGAVGWIDTGGASLQVAFAPQESSILGNVYPLNSLRFTHITNSTGSKYASNVIYAHSWNGLGQREARKRMQRGISNSAKLGNFGERFSGGHHFADPCLLKGQEQTETFSNVNYTFVGASSFLMCEWMVDEYVLNLREECLLQPCGAAGVYIPAAGTLPFVGFSKMLQLARPLGLVDKDDAWAPTYDEISAVVEKVCSMTAEEASKLGIKDDWETDSGPCFRGVLVLRFLQTMGSPRIVFADKIEDDDFTYARGAMIVNVVSQDLVSSSTPADWPRCKDSDLLAEAVMRLKSVHRHERQTEE